MERHLKVDFIVNCSASAGRWAGPSGRPLRTSNDKVNFKVNFPCRAFHINTSVHYLYSYAVCVSKRQNNKLLNIHSCLLVLARLPCDALLSADHVPGRLSRSRCAICAAMSHATTGSVAGEEGVHNVLECQDQSEDGKWGEGGD